MATEGLQKDPEIVEEPWSFRPERFLPEAVEARKEDEVRSLLDHKLMGTPFSFGARMCMGSRLADMEIMTLMAKFTARFDLEAGVLSFGKDVGQVPPGQTWEEKNLTMKEPVSRMACHLSQVPDPMPTLTFTPRT